MNDLADTDGPRVAAVLAAFREHGSKYREHQPANRGWLDRVTAAGADPAHWLYPAPENICLSDGRKLTIAVAHDPREVFLMGSWFRTCLNLRHGCNRTSVIANAADANKAVVYARGPDSRPVARKLVVITTELQAVGFNTYRTGDQVADVTAAMDRYCGAWAGSAGFALVDRGEAEALDGGFWYDDGPAEWSTIARTAWDEARAGRAPVHISDALQPDDRAEADWCAAVRSPDPELLERFLSSAAPARWRTAAGYWYLTLHPDRAARWTGWAKVIAGDRWWRDGWDDTVRQLAARGLGRTAVAVFGRRASDQGYSVAWHVRRGDLLDLMPAAAGPVRATIEAIGRAGWPPAVNDSEMCLCCLTPPPTVSLAPLGEVVQFFAAVDRMFPYAEPGWPPAPGWRRAMNIAWARERDPAPLVRALRDGTPRVRGEVVELCRRVCIPAALAELRRQLRGQRHATDATARIAEVLAVWDRPEDRQRLEALRPPAAAKVDPDPVTQYLDGGGLHADVAAKLSADLARLFTHDNAGPEAIALWREATATFVPNRDGVSPWCGDTSGTPYYQSAIDPRRPLALRLAGAEICWHVGTPNERFALAREWAVAFAPEERSAFSVPLRTELAAVLMTQFGYNGTAAVVRSLLSWGGTLSSADQNALWLAHPSALETVAGRDGREGFPAFLDLLEGSDPVAVTAARTALLALPPVARIPVLDEAFRWLHPDRVERLAIDLVAAAGSRGDAVAAATSTRLRQLLQADVSVS